MAYSFLKSKNYLLHPAVFAALVLTLLNDQYLKYQFPGFITGKLSDFAGLFYFPFFVAALSEIILRKTINFEKIIKSHFILIIVLTDILFVVLKFTDLKTHFTEFMSAYLFKIQIVSDYTDLAALLSSIASYKTAQQYFDKN